MPQPLPGSTSQLGQFADEFKDQASQVVDSPQKILEQILGGKPAPKGDETSIEQDPGGNATNDPQAQALKAQQQQMAQKQDEAQKQDQLKYDYHHRLLQEEQEFYEKKKQEGEMKKQQEEKEKQENPAQQIVQLQHEQEKEDVLGSMIQQNQGSKETKAWGAG
jgi:hypothetical protein